MVVVVIMTFELAFHGEISVNQTAILIDDCRPFNSAEMVKGRREIWK
jgi:hypothetical protein